MNAALLYLKGNCTQKFFMAVCSRALCKKSQTKSTGDDLLEEELLQASMHTTELVVTLEKP